MEKRTGRNGYVFIKVEGKWVAEHRYVYSQAHGPISKGYHIHHLDGDTGNNELSNLMALSIEEHRSLHDRQRFKGADMDCNNIQCDDGKSFAVNSRFFRVHSRFLPKTDIPREDLCARACISCGAVEIFHKTQSIGWYKILWHRVVTKLLGLNEQELKLLYQERYLSVMDLSRFLGEINYQRSLQNKLK